MKATKLQKRIIDILKENTGKHFLDSGFDNGRHWQRNQDKNFLEEKRVLIDTYSDNEFAGYYISLFWYLNDILEITKESEMFNKILNKERKKNDDLFWCADCVEELENHFELDNITEQKNTCNWDSNFTQDFTFIEFEYNEDKFVALQVHNGADIRGGYTDTQIFEMKDDTYMGLADVFGYYADTQVDTYYNGYSLTNEEGENVEFENVELLELDFNANY